MSALTNIGEKHIKQIYDEYHNLHESVESIEVAFKNFYSNLFSSTAHQDLTLCSVCQRFS